MIKIVDIEKCGNITDFNLENKDTVMMTSRELMNMNAEELDNDYVFEGMDYFYHGIYDSNKELIGFKIHSKNLTSY